MTVIPVPAAGLLDDIVIPAVDEPSRFAAYSDGCETAPFGPVDRVLALVGRLLTPGLHTRDA